MDFMNSEDFATDHLEEFKLHTTKLDLIRNQNILSVVPQYEGLF